MDVYGLVAGTGESGGGGGISAAGERDGAGAGAGDVEAPAVPGGGPYGKAEVEAVGVIDTVGTGNDVAGAADDEAVADADVTVVPALVALIDDAVSLVRALMSGSALADPSTVAFIAASPAFSDVWSAALSISAASDGGGLGDSGGRDRSSELRLLGERSSASVASARPRRCF